MKKILFAAVAALAITGCSQNEEMDALGKSEAINFTTAVNRSTKATSMVTNDFKTFSVYAYNVGTEDFNGIGVLGTALFGPEVYSKSEGSWAGSTFYWPVNKSDKLCFFAYSPSNITNYAAATKYPSFNYTVEGVDVQEDFIVAQALNKTRNAQVGLTFNHVLTQINFSAALEADFTYEITEISINGVHESGLFTYDGTSGGWTTQAGTATYTYSGKYDATPVNNVVNFSTADNALMLMPQVVPASATIIVAYKATATNSQVTFDGTKEVDIAGIVWEKGKNIRYKLTLPSGAEPITYNPTVGEWDAAVEKPEPLK